ncbi:TetR/AcrR family transcriptional regulator [Jannaschia pohangensis]|uniref:TetR/AcrR family transcriptional regulator n=1 Tax=Jannaschia pohangensis TaxID=390807 RepID=UPI000ADEA515|nr:TetR/AcrR family transcriptional regulator [Jannaschia pohangensis]
MNQAKDRDTHHHGNLKEAFVSYAIAAADRGALAELSVRQAARDLGVSPGAAYRHFPDKDALMRAVAERGFDALAEVFERTVPFASTARDADHARARFEALAKAYVGFAHDRTELWRLMFGPLGLVPGSNENRPTTYGWLAKCLGELATFAVIAPPRPEHQFFAWSAIHGLSDLQNSPASRGQPRGEVVRQHCALITAALAARPVG